MKEVRSYGAIGWTMAALDSFDKMAECENPTGVPVFFPVSGLVRQAQYLFQEMPGKADDNGAAVIGR